MAAPTESPVVMYDADRVGTAFVCQYYSVLRETPQDVYKFYTDLSKMTRAECGPHADTVTTQEKIHEKVMSKDYGNLKTEILTVDSQESLSGGVLVIVTGCLSDNSTGKRKFLQSFFLAPQEKGYYVLNDIFRYLDEDSSLIKHGQPNDVANGVADIPTQHDSSEQVPADSPAVELVVQEALVEEQAEDLVETDLTDGVEPGDVNESEEPEEFAGDEDDEVVVEMSQQHIKDDAMSASPFDAPVQPLHQTDPAATQISQEELAGEKPKKFSYASVLTMKQQQSQTLPQASRSVEASSRPSPPPTLDVGISEPIATVGTAGADFQPVPLAAPTPEPVQESSEETSTPEVEAAVPPQENRYNERGDGRSVFLRNLPLTITQTELADIVHQFGPVKMNHIQIRGKSQNANSCFAFVEFEDVASAQAAIEKATLLIGSFNVRIEEKKPMGPKPMGYRGGGRGGHGGRTDRPFRNDSNNRVSGRQPFGNGGRMGSRAQSGPDNRDRDGPQNRSRGAGAPGRPGLQGAGAGLGQGPDRNGGPPVDPIRKTGVDSVGGSNRAPRRLGVSGHGGSRGGGPPRSGGPANASNE